MKPLSRSLLACSAVLLLSKNISAQTDTALLDLGRIQVRKEFTQHISIKGEDLEKFPAANLSEALKVWLYGTFSNKYSLTYIVDGNLTTDVNVYSVYDIEEVTMVQNAMGQLNGVVQNAQLVYIETRRNQPGTSGIRAAAQANLVERRLLHPADKAAERTDEEKTSDLSLFHRYFISAYKNTSRSKFGVSAAYLKDVFPTVESDNQEIIKEPRLSRFNFNGYANTQIGKSSSLDVFLNYAPQGIKEEENLSTTNSLTEGITKNKIALMNSGLKFKTNLSKAFTHTLNFDYGNYNQNDIGQAIQQSEYTGYSVYSKTRKYARQTANNFLLRNNLAYTKSFGGWTVDPSLNFSFRYRNSHKTDSLGQLTYHNGQNLGNSYSISWSQAYTRVYLLTPSINFYYKDIFNIQGGLLYNLSETEGADIKRRFPFVSSSIDVVRLLDRDSKSGLRLFGSYAETGSFEDDLDLAANLDDQFYLPQSFNSLAYMGRQANWNLNGPDERHYESIQAGADLSLSQRLTLSYTFNQRDYNLAFLQPIYYLDYYYPFLPGGPSYMLIPAKTEMKIQALRVSAKILNNSKVTWNSSASVATVYHTLNEETNYLGYLIDYTYVNNTYLMLDEGRRVWSGGWANRLNVKGFTAEVDLLAKFRGTINNENNPSGVYNSLVLQNLSFGYRIPSSKFQGLEIYLNSRNLLSNKKQNITDGRKYFGLGLKAAISR